MSPDYTDTRFMSVVTFTDANFQKEVLESEVPVLVDFWAEWCQPCQMVGPVVDELAEEYKGKMVMGKMNVDENAEVPGTYGIMSIPSLLVFKKGEPVKTFVGVQSKDVFKKAFDEVLSA